MYVPHDFTWRENLRATPGVAVTSYGGHLLQARLHFADTDRVAWSFTFDVVQDQPCLSA
jgi:hypothetical protein